MGLIHMFDYNKLSPQEQVCFHLARNDLQGLEHLLSTVSQKRKPKLFEQGIRLCEQDNTPLSQQAFASGELFSLHFNDVELQVDAVGEQMLQYYQEIYHGQVTQGLRHAMLDEQIYKRFYLLRSEKQRVAKVERTESKRHDVSLNLETVKLFIDASMAKSEKHTRSYMVLHLGYHQIEFKVSSKEATKLGKQCVLNLYNEELDIYCKGVKFERDSVADISSKNSTLTFRRCYIDVGHEKSFVAFFEACIGCYPLAAEQKQDQLQTWFKQARLLSSSQSVLPILTSTHQDKQTTELIGVLQHENNQKLINSLASGRELELCQTAINRLILRAHPTQEMYYFTALTNKGKALAREDLDHDVSDLVRLGVSNGSLMVFKVNVEKVRPRDARWLYVLANGDSLSTDLVETLRMIYLTSIPLDIRVLKSNIQNLTEYPIESVLPKEKWRNLPILKYSDKDMRGELRYFYKDSCLVHFKLFSNVIFDVVNLSVSGLCISPRQKKLKIQIGQQLVISVLSLGVRKACYKVVSVDIGRQLYRLQLVKKHRRAKATVKVINGILAAADNQTISNNCEQKALYNYRFCHLLAAMYLPHLSLSRESALDTLVGSAVCSYRLSGLVDCKVPIFVKYNGKEFFKINDFIGEDMLRGNTDLHEISQTPLLIGICDVEGKQKRITNVLDSQHDSHVFVWQPESVCSLPRPIQDLLSGVTYTEYSTDPSELNNRTVAIYHISYLYSLLYRSGCIPRNNTVRYDGDTKTVGN